MKPTKEQIDAVCKEFADRGLLIEAGWQSLRFMAIHPEAPPNQLDEMHLAFFAGAQHLFGSIMSILEPDAEPTAADLHRMDLIDKELEAWVEDYKLRMARAQGSA